MSPKLTVTVDAKTCKWCGCLYPATNKYNYCTYDCSLEAHERKAWEPPGREPVLLEDYTGIPSQPLVDEAWDENDYEDVQDRIA